jgi:hypothetical protein
MGQNNLDQYIKNTLANHSTPIDTDLLWSDIQKRKSKPFLLYLSSGIVVLAALVVGLSVYMSSRQVVSPVVNNYKMAVSENATASDINIQADDKNTTLPNENSSIMANSESEIAVQPGVMKNLPSKFNSEPDAGLPIINDLKEKSGFNAEGQLTSVNNRNISSDSGDNTSQTDENFTNTNESFVPAQNLHASMTDEFENESQLADQLSKKIQFVESLKNLTNRDLTLEHARAYEEMRVQSTDCPSFAAKKNHLLLEVYSSLDYILNNYAVAAENMNYLDERKSSQSYRPGFRAGAQLKYLFHNGFFVKGGIEYGVAREKFRYRTETTSVEIVPNQLIGIFIDTNGDTIKTYGNAPVTTIATKNWRIKNAYKSIDIPLSIGYQINRGKFFYSIEAGVINNINFGFKGMLLDTSFTPVQAQDYFRNKIGLAYTGGVTAGYALRPELNIFLRASFKKYTKLINSIENPVDQKYTAIGTGIGLEYKF